MTIQLLDLAKRFRDFTLDRPEPESFNVWHKNNNSVGNRYIDRASVTAYRNAPEGSKVLDRDEMYEKVQHGSCCWWHLFHGIHYGLIVGPKTLAAVEECLELLRTDEPPEDDGIKVRNVNRLGGVNYLSKPVNHDWKLTDRLGKIMSSAFFQDRRDRPLYSDDFSFVYSSYNGWSRST